MFFGKRAHIRNAFVLLLVLIVVCSVPVICSAVSFIFRGRTNTNKVLAKLIAFSQTGNIWEMDAERNINVVFWVKEQFEINEILRELYKSCEGIVDTEIMVLTAMSGK